MALLTWLPDVLRSSWPDVHVMPGAETRTTQARGVPDDPPGIIWHHTATSRTWQDGHVAYLLRDGHRQLPGPLAQVGVERDGTVIVVALGRCNHDGYGRWGNDSIGWELYNDGRGEPYLPVQLEAAQRTIAAVLNHLGYGASKCLGHKESASHKIDPLLNMHAMRARIAYFQTAPPQEDEMATYSLDEARETMRFVLHRLQGSEPSDRQVEEHAHALAADPRYMARVQADLIDRRVARLEERVRKISTTGPVDPGEVRRIIAEALR